MGGNSFIFQSYNMTIFRPRLRFLNCLFPFRGTTSWTLAGKEKAQILIRQMGKNVYINLTQLILITLFRASILFRPLLSHHQGVVQKHCVLALKNILFLLSKTWCSWAQKIVFLRSKTFCSYAQLRSKHVSQKHCVPVLKNTVFLRSTALKNMVFLSSKHCFHALKDIVFLHSKHYVPKVNCAQKHDVPALKHNVLLRSKR